MSSISTKLHINGLFLICAKGSYVFRKRNKNSFFFPVFQLIASKRAFFMIGNLTFFVPDKVNGRVKQMKQKFQLRTKFSKTIADTLKPAKKSSPKNGIRREIKKLANISNAAQNPLLK